MSPAVADGALASELIEHGRARLIKWSCPREGSGGAAADKVDRSASCAVAALVPGREL